MELAFGPQNTTVTLAASTSAASAALTQPRMNQVRVVNATSSLAYIAFGSATVAATSASLPVLPNTVEVFTVDPNATTVSGLLATGSGSLYFTNGEGL